MRPVAPDPVGTEILSQLHSTDPYDQYFAVMSLCDLARTELVPALVPLLQSQLADLRYVAAQAIGEFGTANRGYYGPLLVPFLESHDPEMRQHAAEALASLDFQESIPAIERMLDAEVDEDTRQFTERALRVLKHDVVPVDETPLLGAGGAQRAFSATVQ